MLASLEGIFKYNLHVHMHIFSILSQFSYLHGVFSNQPKKIPNKIQNGTKQYRKFPGKDSRTEILRLLSKFPKQRSVSHKILKISGRKSNGKEIPCKKISLNFGQHGVHVPCRLSSFLEILENAVHSKSFIKWKAAIDAMT